MIAYQLVVQTEILIFCFVAYLFWFHSVKLGDLMKYKH